MQTTHSCVLADCNRPLYGHKPLVLQGRVFQKGMKQQMPGGAEVCIKREFEPRVTLGTILSDFNLELL